MKRKGKVPKRESLARQFLLELLEDPDSTSARPSCVSDAELARSIDDCFADPLMVTKIVHRLAKIRGGAANTPAQVAGFDEPTLEAIRSAGFVGAYEAAEDKDCFGRLLRRMVIDDRIVRQVRDAIYARDDVPDYWHKRVLARPLDAKRK